MKTTPKWDKALRFVFWVTPFALWLHQTTVAEPSHAVRSTLPPPRAAASLPEETLETLLPVPVGFKTVARVVELPHESVSRTYQNQPYRRRMVYVTVPDGLSREAVDANLRAVARNMYRAGVMSVVVAAYYQSESAAVGTGTAIPAGILMFAPDGDFHKTDEIFDVSEYRVTIQHPSDDPLHP